MGCYGHSPNILQDGFEDYRDLLAPWSPETYLKVINLCSKLAQERGAAYFGIEFYGECYLGISDSVQYTQNGISGECMSGLGRADNIFIYKQGQYNL